ncbi:MAG: ABC transporter ATP-binding protein [candidate division NC10 bacterium]|nr:ABC transporter ATP-binding protein [candidate division NC10 bacterium]
MVSGTARAVRTPVVEVDGLHHHYGSREALAGISLEISRGEIFGLLGPNGGGKTTLFKILSTLMPATRGTVRVFGHDLVREPDAIRRHLGVVFQHPSLDSKLTVMENLQHHGHLYGLRGTALQTRAEALLERLDLGERSHDRVETLSGGLRRRVELAKALVHQPDLLLLDEPSTGLDPGARRDFTNYLGQLREQDGVTVVLTTHILVEAERCDRVGILHRGKLVALGTPDDLKARLGGDVVVVQSLNPQRLQGRLRERFGCEPVLVDGSLRVERPRGHEFVREIVDAFPGEVQSVSFGKPTLEDVFIHLTGRRLWGEAANGGGPA